MTPFFMRTIEPVYIAKLGNAGHPLWHNRVRHVSAARVVLSRLRIFIVEPCRLAILVRSSIPNPVPSLVDHALMADRRIGIRNKALYIAAIFANPSDSPRYKPRLSICRGIVFNEEPCQFPRQFHAVPLHRLAWRKSEYNAADYRILEYLSKSASVQTTTPGQR